MPQTHAFWEENSRNMQHIKYESSNCNDDHPRLKDDRNMYAFMDTNLNFATGPCSEDESEYGSVHYKKNKVSRQDPMSHRIIEKRRRDRMNNCLADLSRLIPTEYLKKGRGRIEKTEIIEMAIQYMKHLQQLHVSPTEHYRLGYQDCMSEAMQFLVEVEGHFPREPFCVRFLGHLQKHLEALPLSSVKNNSEQFQSLQDCAKSVVEPNNNNEVVENMIEDEIDCSSSSALDKNADNNGSMSYKYKTDIKMRFTQDITAAKTDICEDTQNQPIISIENINHGSASQDVPRISSPAMFVPRSYHFKIDLPQKHSPMLNSPVQQESRMDLKNNFNIPIFVLHTKGSFYIPASIDYITLLPFLQSNILETAPNVHDVLHPVTINVNFQPTPAKYKTDINDWQ